MRKKTRPIQWDATYSTIQCSLILNTEITYCGSYAVVMALDSSVKLSAMESDAMLPSFAAFIAGFVFQGRVVNVRTGGRRDRNN